MSNSFNKAEYKEKMQGTIDALNKDFSGLRAGRASASLLEPVKVDAYGSLMPLTQVSTIVVPEARMLSVQVWDKGLVSAVEKAIRDAGLGVNPVTDGQNVRVPLPTLTEERRRELVKVASKYAETSRVAIRGIRRDAMETLKKLEKDSDISEDDHHRFGKEIQEMTDQFIKTVDQGLSKKEADIMHV